MEKELKL